MNPVQRARFGLSGGDKHVAGERLLARAEDSLRAVRAAGFEQLVVAREWAFLHRRPENAPRGSTGTRSSAYRALGAVGLPVYEYACAELAVSLQVAPLAAQRLMGDAVDLHERLPETWAALERLDLEVWVARKITHLTRDLSDEAVLKVDAQLASVLGSLPTGRLLSVVEARVVAADQAAADARAEAARRARTLHLSQPAKDPATGLTDGTRTLYARLDATDALRFHGTATAIARILAEQQAEQQSAAEGADRAQTHDELLTRAVGILADPSLALHLLTDGDTARPSSARPRTVLYVHTTPGQLTGQLTGDQNGPTSTGVARGEDLGPLTRRQLIRLLGHEHVTLRPVIDLTDQVAADCYEVPASLTERLHLTRPYDVFPYATSLSRTMDQDHTQPYIHDTQHRPAPPGQTRIDNLAKMTRRHHRIKTHSPGWTLHQTNGTFWWTTPHGRIIAVDPLGTHKLNTGPPRPEIDIECALPTFPITVDHACWS